LIRHALHRLQPNGMTNQLVSPTTEALVTLDEKPDGSPGQGRAIERETDECEDARRCVARDVDHRRDIKAWPQYARYEVDRVGPVLGAQGKRL
jgi:hypothetical protein